MKYGTHAHEPPDAILNRKLSEVSLCGRTFWGYGGNVCHPTRQVQPFLEANLATGEKTYLVMSRINSTWSGDTSRANFYSFDNLDWAPIPPENVVTGSKYAIICKNFKLCDFDLDLSCYRVPVGPAAGRLLSSYISGHNTKGCGTFQPPDDLEAPKILHISAIAEIEGAVFVR